MIAEISKFLISPADSIRAAMACIDANERGIALVTDCEGRLLATVTDGDLRRAMLSGADLDESVAELIARRGPLHGPVCAPAGSGPETLISLMREKGVRQVPTVDEAGRVCDLVAVDDLLPGHAIPMQAVIMAGGFGTRLRPLTDELPKPMLPVGDRPLLELIVEQLQQAGVKRVNVTTHFKPEKIIQHFGDGGAFGVELNYINEDRPLGTAGALGLMPPPSEPLLVINGDILTDVNFRSMLAFHQEHAAELTVAVRNYEIKVPYGVVECHGSKVVALREKPSFKYFINAGIYLLQPSVYKHIPYGERFNMTDLIQLLLRAGKPVISFPVREYWLDIGQRADYLQAQQDAKERRII